MLAALIQQLLGETATQLQAVLDLVEVALGELVAEIQGTFAGRMDVGGREIHGRSLQIGKEATVSMGRDSLRAV
jgi:hypothetical protein